jgi:hypothetical protein
VAASHWDYLHYRRAASGVNGMAIDERTPIKLALFGGRVLA